MLSNTIIEKIEDKYGKKNLTSADCPSLSESIGISETTLKRMLGLVGKNSPERNRTPYTSTLDLLARWLGYENYRALLIELNEGNFSSDFASMQTIRSKNLTVGDQIQLRYEPGRVLVMTYLGNDEFVMNESINSKLQKGDHLMLTDLMLGQMFYVSNVVRDGRSLGAYQGAKDGGLTSLEIVV